MKALLALTTALVAIATAAPAALADGFITDTLGGNGHPKQTQGYKFMTDTLSPGGGTQVEVVSAGSGFNWADAGVGAATTVGSLLVLIGGTLLALRHRGRLAI